MITIRARADIHVYRLNTSFLSQINGKAEYVLT
jgi:hypothetical protein